MTNSGRLDIKKTTPQFGYRLPALGCLFPRLLALLLMSDRLVACLGPVCLSRHTTSTSSGPLLKPEKDGVLCKSWNRKKNHPRYSNSPGRL